MNDVARKAGVSLKTVSRVVNGEPTVDPALASRVRAAVAALGYRPNLGAALLRRGDQRTGTIGVVVPDVGDPFAAALLRSIEDESRPRGVQVLAGSHGEGAMAAMADGLIVVSAGGPGRITDVPVVLVGRPALAWAADTVEATNRAGAEVAVRHLIRQGHQRIAYLGTLPGARRNAYRSAMHEAGLINVERTEPVQALMEEPTALFTESRPVTVAAIRALRDAQMQHRVALVGFDDFPLADLLDPGVTVVARDAVAMGRAAVRALFERIAGGTEKPRMISVPTTLITRGSGEIPVTGS